MSAWIASHLGDSVPLHFSAFHPDYKMLDTPATPLQTLIRARDIAQAYASHATISTGMYNRVTGTVWVSALNQVESRADTITV